MQSEWCVSEYDANTVHPSLAVPFSVTHREVRINSKKKKNTIMTLVATVFLMNFIIVIIS